MASKTKRAKKAKGVKAGADRQVTFSCVAPEAKEVSLVGCFNSWEPKALPMQRSAAGEWSASVELPPGRFQYRFFIDGVWRCDPQCDDPAMSMCSKCVPNDFGGMNRFIVVG